MRELQTPPSRLVVDGRLQHGTYQAPFRQTNALDAEIVAPWRWPEPVRRWRLKEWQALQLGNDRLFGMVALFDAKVLALVQVKLYDRVTRRKMLYEAKVAPWTLQLSSTLLDSEVAHRQRGQRVAFRNRLRDGRVTVELELDRGLRRPALAGRLTGWADGVRPMVTCQPFGGGRGMYSHKALLPAEGWLDVGGERIVFGRADSHVLLDDHKGFYPYVMRWDWVTAAGRDPAGRLVGFNLTRNQCVEPDRYGENGFWIDGELHLLPPVRFTRLPKRRFGRGARDGTGEWRIRDQRGQVDLRFDATVGGRVDVNALLIRSRYRGPFGTFRGRLVADDGEVLDVEDLFGMGEDFYLRC